MLPASRRVRGPAPLPVSDWPVGQRVDGPLRQYRPLRWELVTTAAQRGQWRQLLAQHHYLGAPHLVGPNLKYLAYGRGGELLGALGWHSAVQNLGCRDRLLGWNATQRARGLGHVVNGVRFLILPWVKVRHLASVMLSENLRLLPQDWRQRYGVDLWLAESFVDRQRFSGASYRAANWQALGWTRGFAKQQGRFVHHGQSKEVYVYVMEARMRQFIHGDDRQPRLNRALLLAQRLSEEKPFITKSERMTKILESWKPKLPPQCELSLEDLATVGRELNEFTALFQPTFGRREPAALLELYLQGLLSDAERKNVEAIALKLDGPQRVRNLQRFVSDYQFDNRVGAIASISTGNDGGGVHGLQAGVCSVDGSFLSKTVMTSSGPANSGDPSPGDGGASWLISYTAAEIPLIAPSFTYQFSFISQSPALGTTSRENGVSGGFQWTLPLDGSVEAIVEGEFFSVTPGLTFDYGDWELDLAATWRNSDDLTESSDDVLLSASVSYNFFSPQTQIQFGYAYQDTSYGVDHMIGMQINMSINMISYGLLGK